MSSQDWTYERADRAPGHDEVTLYFHRTDVITAQTKVTLPDAAAAVTWAAQRRFPDPSNDLGPDGGSRFAQPGQKID